ncbi:MAG: hypothetical protein O2999_14275 [Nitrospirae bacterium]|nr:hypothetical protein [Nitrospirota bacterium]MDA1305428.1 hypothetical protein [Nitrospirota bacterium]
MKTLKSLFILGFLLSFSHTGLADFNFYEEKCEEVAELGCKEPLVPGPKCLVTAQGACK